MLDTLIYIIIFFVILGLVLYLINRFVPMQDNVKELMNVVVIVILVVFVLIWLLRALPHGNFPSLGL